MYNFTKIFLSEAVKETILIENWEENKDFDPRYEEYAKFFLFMKNKYISGLQGDNLINELTGYKDKLVSNFNKKLNNHFITEIMRRGCAAKELANQLIPKNIFFDNEINTNALKIFRALEEKI